MMPRPWLPPPPAEASALPQSNSQPSNGSGTAELEEWNTTASFMNKPSRGWLHSDQKISDSGICYGVRYIGCLEVNTSMKSLAFETRSLIAKECINKLCETAGLKTVDKKRKVDKRLMKMMSDTPNMDFAGSNVSLTITSSYLNLICMETSEVIAYHEMPKISFASGGDAETLDFVSYVAKDHRYGRACFVLECGGGLAQDVITTIGQAFELRYKQFLKRVPSSRNEAEMHQASVQNGNSVPAREDPEYYNDLPGKVPPDLINNTTFLDNASITSGSQISLLMKDSAPPSYPATPLFKDMPESLIDLTSNTQNIQVYRKPGPEYVNTTAVISSERPNDNTLKSKAVKHDIFDMQPFTANLPITDTSETKSLLISSTNMLPLDSASQQFSSLNKMEIMQAALMEEAWFHGPISRQESEALVAKEGDFLVRESQSTPGQYVLTGMQKSSRKHLLLVDPEGVIRTKDQVFESVSHLIRYHKDNCLPIISAESALLLRTPVCRIRSGKSIQV